MDERVDYNTIMLAKLVGALRRRGTEQDGNWGYPSFAAELAEIDASLQATEAVKRAPKITPSKL